MPDPEPIGPDLDAILLRCIVPGTAERYDALKKELKEALKEVEQRYKRALRFLRQHGAKPDQFVELEEEKRQFVEHHRREFKRKLDRLLEECLDEEA